MKKVLEEKLSLKKKYSLNNTANIIQCMQNRVTQIEAQEKKRKKMKKVEL